MRVLVMNGDTYPLRTQGENVYIDRLMNRVDKYSTTMAIGELDRLIRSIEELGGLFGVSEEDRYKTELIEECKDIISDPMGLITYWGL